MSKVKDIIDSIRDTLSDPEGDRWKNTRLIRGINEAMKDINLKAKILRGKGVLNLSAGVGTYILPNDVQALTRCLYNGKPIEFKTHDEMDEMFYEWEDTIGTEVKFVVYDKLNMGMIKTYPIVASSIDSISSAFGVVTDLTDFEFNSAFGVLVDMYEPKGDLVLYYIKKPTPVENMGDELPINDVWDKAIKHYVCGYTLRDDKDTQNRAFGDEELGFYADEVKESKGLSGEHFTPNAEHMTEYRRL